MHILIAYLLNIIDLLLTRFFINKGFTELNPFASFLLYHNLDGIFKIFVVGLALFYIWLKRDLKVANIAAWIAFSFYVFVSIWWVGQIMIYIKYK